MGEAETTTVPETAEGKDRNFGRRLIVVAILLVVLVLSWWIGGAVIPRWWAQRVTDVIDGRLLFGNLFGFGMGFVFTIVPLMILWLGWKFRGGSWKRMLIFVALAVVAATPNLLTLGIVLGTGNAAHAAERTLDVDGPGFRGGTTLGAITAVFAFAAVGWLVRSRRKNKRRAAELSEELKSRDD